MPLSASKMNDCDPLAALKSFLQKDLVSLDQVIEQSMGSSVPLISELSRHIINAGGKRLRAILTVASYRLFQPQEGDGAIGLAAAVEFIHTATLLHDDVIDNSKLRRGVPTANEVWGNQASVLVGDFLFARSFQLMIAAQNFDVLRILADAAARISEGEVLQLSLCHKLNICQEDSLRIIEAKTAMLFAAACEVGVLMTKQCEYAPALRAYGLNLGMAFQIVDDILDYCSHVGKLGKEVGNDFREGKITLPLTLAYPHCSKGEKEFLSKNFIDHIQTNEDFSTTLEILHKHKGLDRAYDLAKEYGEKARETLLTVPNNTIKSLLIDLIDHCLKREY